MKESSFFFINCQSSKSEKTRVVVRAALRQNIQNPIILHRRYKVESKYKDSHKTVKQQQEKQNALKRQLTLSFSVHFVLL